MRQGGSTGLLPSELRGVHPEAVMVGTAGGNASLGWTSAEEGCGEREYQRICGCADSAVQTYPPSQQNIALHLCKLLGF